MVKQIMQNHRSENQENNTVVSKKHNPREVVFLGDLHYKLLVVKKNAAIREHPYTLVKRDKSRDQ